MLCRFTGCQCSAPEQFSLSVFKDGTEVVNRNFGPSAECFKIGSISKVFTAVLLWQLYEKGEISFDEHLSDYFPQVPNSENITLANILKHRSGLQDYLEKIGGDESWLFVPVASQDIIDEIVKQGVAFAPDSTYRYSNSGYYLLTKIVEKKYGKPYREILEKQILKLLSLNTMIDTTLIPAGNTYKDFSPINITGVGDLCSSMSDINVFLNGLFEDRLVSQNTLKEMLPSEDDFMGCGIIQVKYKGLTYYGHTGGTMVSNTVGIIDPVSKISISFGAIGYDYQITPILKRLIQIINK